MGLLVFAVEIRAGGRRFAQCRGDECGLAWLGYGMPLEKLNLKTGTNYLTRSGAAGSR